MAARWLVAGMLVFVACGGSDSGLSHADAAQRYRNLADAGWFTDSRSVDELGDAFANGLSEKPDCGLDDTDTGFLFAMGDDSDDLTAVRLTVAYCPDVDPVTLSVMSETSLQDVQAMLGDAPALTVSCDDDTTAVVTELDSGLWRFEHESGWASTSDRDEMEIDAENFGCDLG